MTPTDFRRALTREFPDLRLRWSDARRAWLLEAKAGRGLFDVETATEDRRRADERVQLRDGYRLFMELREYPQMPCHACGAGLKLKPFTTLQATCPVCRYVHTVSCFPFGDVLLDELRKLNPKGPYRDRVKAELDRENARRTAAAEREASTAIEASTFDDYNLLVGIPSFGYAGKTGAWVGAPASPLTPQGSHAA
jgi:hypothetical protein